VDEAEVDYLIVAEGDAASQDRSLVRHPTLSRRICDDPGREEYPKGPCQGRHRSGAGPAANCGHNADLGLSPAKEAPEKEDSGEVSV